MNGTGRHRKNSDNLVVLLLVVGLTAFSHFMKELTEIHEWDASRLVAQWSGNVAPAEISPAIVKVEKPESCESKQSAASVELPWLSEQSAVAPSRNQQSKIQRVTRPDIVIPSETEIARLKKLERLGITAEQLEVRLPDVQFPEASDFEIADEMTDFTFKMKARKPGVIKLHPRDHEMILKRQNRIISLRIAS